MRKAKTINAKFKTDFVRQVDLTKKKIHEAARLALLEVGRRLVDYSPVGDPTTWKRAYWPKGYEPGQFVNNWQLGIGEKPSGIIEGSDPSGQDAIARMNKISRWPGYKTFHFTNNLPYAYRLETGWSPQCPPGGMIGRIKREWPLIVQEAAQKVRTSGSIE